jgi:hypothetical protein
LFKPREDEEGVFQAVQNIYSSLGKALKNGHDILMLVEGFIDSKKGCINKEALQDYDPIELNTIRQDISERTLYLQAVLGIAAEVDGLKATINGKTVLPKQ